MGASLLIGGNPWWPDTGKTKTTLTFLYQLITQKGVVLVYFGLDTSSCNC